MLKAHSSYSSFNKDIFNSSILVVDDDKTTRLLLVEALRNEGFYAIKEATNGREALEIISNEHLDLIILDIIMPEINGIECCTLIRNDPDENIARTPILIQTGLSSIIDKIRLFKAGATDYITKPFDAKEIIVRSISHLEREVMLRNLHDFNDRIVKELEIARETQKIIIPTTEEIEEIETSYNLEIFEHFEPSSELGGDFWGVNKISKHKFAVYSIDFSGHGVNAALNVFRLHTLMNNSQKVNKNAGNYMTYLNNILAKLLPNDQFATMFYGIVDTKLNKISYASSGSPDPIIIKSDGKYEIIDSSGLPMGIDVNRVYKSTDIDFNEEDCLLLYSDALTETKNQGGEILSVSDIAKSFQRNLKAEKNSYQKSFNLLVNNFYRDYANNLNDDLTLTAYYRKPPKP